MRKINVAIIGCGRIAGHHLNAIKKNINMKAVAVCDIDVQKAIQYSKEFDIPYFTNYREMFDKFTFIDMVVIATPSGMHYEHSIEIIDRFKKNIIVEKPTFMRHDQLDRAYELADKNDVKIFPVFQNRYNKAVKRVKKAIEADELGDIRILNVRVRWCRPQRYYELSPWRGLIHMMEVH